MHQQSYQTGRTEKCRIHYHMNITNILDGRHSVLQTHDEYRLDDRDILAESDRPYSCLIVDRILSCKIAKVRRHKRRGHQQ